MNQGNSNPTDYRVAIAASGYDIYRDITVGDRELWIPTNELESFLNAGLIGVSLAGLALRTRSKVVKEAVCKALGYPVPSSFKKTQPRFPGQCFDTYVQKASNLQIWNEEISPSRRYVVIGVDATDLIVRVRVLTGDELAKYDTTGTLTQKYQARLTPGAGGSELVTPEDTTNLLRVVTAKGTLDKIEGAPIAYPEASTLLPISDVYERLQGLVGRTFADSGRDQERNRGWELHRLVCEVLRYGSHLDDGRFPDVKHQLLEVKLQTSPTIDLGLVRPDSTDPLDVPQIKGVQIRHCDVRYALFSGTTDGSTVTLTNLYVTNGEGFFRRFPQFGGQVLNKKLQLHLPGDFFK